MDAFGRSLYQDVCEYKEAQLRWAPYDLGCISRRGVGPLVYFNRLIDASLYLELLSKQFRRMLICYVSYSTPEERDAASKTEFTLFGLDLRWFDSGDRV